jgi:quercetin dioxygenase-like cupin family protein
MTRPPTLRKSHEGRTIAVVGDIYRFLATGEDTAGKYAMFESTLSPGGGPPPHTHSREEESFYVLEGTVTFQVGDKKWTATAGDFANVPIGCLHCFKNETDKSARMLVTVTPAGLDQMFLETGVPVAPGESPPPPSAAEIERLLAAAPKYGIEIHLPKP